MRDKKLRLQHIVSRLLLLYLYFVSTYLVRRRCTMAQHVVGASTFVLFIRHAAAQRASRVGVELAQRSLGDYRDAVLVFCVGKHGKQLVK